MFLFLETYFPRVTVSLLCLLQAVSKIHVPIFPSLIIVKGDEIVRHCDRHSSETVTLREQVYKYKNMHKWIVEFFRKFENSSIKISRVNLTLMTESINLQLFTLILYSVGSPLRC